MRFRWVGWGATGLLLISIGDTPRTRSEAQSFGGGVQSGMMMPRFSRQGDWAEVVTATPKWLVIQNEAGQQFPVSLESVDVFLMRWPTSLDRVPIDALVETVGVELGSNQIRTDHVDVYEGATRSLVVPGLQHLIGFNRVLTAFDIDQMNTYGVVYQLLPGESQIPNRMHVVGPVADKNPLRLAVPGNNAVTIQSSEAGLTLSLITPGSISLVEKGDLVYFLAEDAAPKTLTISQMVVYKKRPQPQ